MKLTKNHLKKLIQEAVKTALKENESLATSNVEAQLEDAIGVLEMISQRIMSFPLENTKAVEMLPRLIENLEKIDGFLSKFVNLQQMNEDTSLSKNEDDFSHGGKIPLARIKKRAESINSEYVIGVITRVAREPQEYWDLYLGPRFGDAFKTAFNGWDEKDLVVLSNIISGKT
jgi:hypothetical protein